MRLQCCSDLIHGEGFQKKAIVFRDGLLGRLASAHCEQKGVGWADTAQFASQRCGGKTWHLRVGEHKVGCADRVMDLGDRVLAGVCALNLVALGHKQYGEQLTADRIVVDDQNARRFGLRHHVWRVEYQAMHAGATGGWIGHHGFS